MTDDEPAAAAAAAASIAAASPSSSGSVTRGMRALLARRDDAMAAGATPVGWKTGFNTPAIRELFGLTDPLVGYLVDTGVSPDGATVSLAGWSAAAVEVELAIRVGAHGSVAGMAPALELVDLGISFDDIEVSTPGPWQPA
jgi:2-keto-4-pentenoate hydratase